MPKLSKILLGCMLGFGVFTISVTIVRVVVIMHTNFSDFSFSSKGIFIWTAVNYGTGILVACCPLLRPFIEKLSPKSLLESIRKSTSMTTSLTADTSRKHSEFSRLDEEGIPLHNISPKSIGAQKNDGLSREETFIQGPTRFQSAVYSGSKNPDVENGGINVKTELRVDSVKMV